MPTPTPAGAMPAPAVSPVATRFGIGTVQDLTNALRFAHDHGIEMPSRAWGLKLLGYSVCARTLHDPRFHRLLEAGVGFGDEMYRALGGADSQRELWTIDNSEFYTPERVAEGRAKREHCTNIDGLLGDFSPRLPDAHFDAVFSISALEHAPMDTVRAVCEDAFRVTAPGGLSVHTLDFAFDTIPERIEPWLAELRRAGFEIDEAGVDLTVGLSNREGEAYLFEPVEKVFTRWCGRRIDDNKPLPRFTTQHAAVIAVARKPG